MTNKTNYKLNLPANFVTYYVKAGIKHTFAMRAQECNSKTMLQLYWYCCTWHTQPKKQQGMVFHEICVVYRCCYTQQDTLIIQIIRYCLEICFQFQVQASDHSCLLRFMRQVWNHFFQNFENKHHLGRQLNLFSNLFNTIKYISYKY